MPRTVPSVWLDLGLKLVTGLGWSRNLAGGGCFEVPAVATGAAETASAATAARMLSVRIMMGLAARSGSCSICCFLPGMTLSLSLMSFLPQGLQKGLRIPVTGAQTGAQ